MNCASFEKLIALYVEDDLSGRKKKLTEERVAACAACREFARELKTSQAVLKSLSDESVSEAAFAKLRAGVLERIAAQQQRHEFPAWRYALAAGLVALAVVSSVALLRRQPRAPRTPSAELKVPPQRQPEAAAVTMTLSAPRPVRSRQARSVHHQQPTAPRTLIARNESPAPEPLKIKLITDNPDVVIYWLVD